MLAMLTTFFGVFSQTHLVTWSPCSWLPNHFWTLHLMKGMQSPDTGAVFIFHMPGAEHCDTMWVALALSLIITTPLIYKMVRM
jgi:hypothetical protein